MVSHVLHLIIGEHTDGIKWVEARILKDLLVHVVRLYAPKDALNTAYNFGTEYAGNVKQRVTTYTRKIIVKSVGSLL